MLHETKMWHNGIYSVENSASTVFGYKECLTYIFSKFNIKVIIENYTVGPRKWILSFLNLFFARGKQIFLAYI